LKTEFAGVPKIKRKKSKHDDAKYIAWSEDKTVSDFLPSGQRLETREKF
jgi:hypothetical protein